MPYALRPARLGRAALAAAVLFSPLLAGIATPVQGQTSLQAREPIFSVSGTPGEERMLLRHLDQRLIDSGDVSLSRIVAHGKFLFDAALTASDGVGRPGLNGEFPPLNREARSDADSGNRISGPDADSCGGCHNKPRVGGGGDNVANTFVLGQRFSFFGDPTRDDENGTVAPGTLQSAANERNTQSIFGSGVIELLAREMTADLHALRDKAKAQAAQTGANVTLPLTTKGVNFGTITAQPDGRVLTGGIEGIEIDLVIRPFGFKGTSNSLREFTNSGFFRHQGLQSVERFGLDSDGDGDGVVNELSVGDVTAATLFQATLAVPGQVIPRNSTIANAIRRGEQVFRQAGCGSCHIPEMRLNSSVFTEPNPYNSPFDLRPSDVPRPYSVDLARVGELPRPERAASGMIVRAFTDLKRHDMGTHPLINNEITRHAGVPTGTFITTRLWGLYSSPHFLHNGRATLLSQAILAHGGEAQQSRDNFAALSSNDRNSVVEFLKSLRVLPSGTKSLVVDEYGLATSKR